MALIIKPQNTKQIEQHETARQTSELLDMAAYMAKYNNASKNFAGVIYLYQVYRVVIQNS